MSSPNISLNELIKGLKNGSVAEDIPQADVVAAFKVAAKEMGMTDDVNRQFLKGTDRINQDPEEGIPLQLLQKTVEKLQQTVTAPQRASLTAFCVQNGIPIAPWVA